MSPGTSTRQNKKPKILSLGRFLAPPTKISYTTPHYYSKYEFWPKIKKLWTIPLMFFNILKILTIKDPHRFITVPEVVFAKDHLWNVIAPSLHHYTITPSSEEVLIKLSSTYSIWWLCNNSWYYDLWKWYEESNGNEMMMLFPESPLHCTKYPNNCFQSVTTHRWKLLWLWLF